VAVPKTEYNLYTECMYDVCVYGGRERGGMYKVFWWRNLRKGDFLEDLGIDERIILKQSFKKQERGLE
jgi:hypothetical protein